MFDWHSIPEITWNTKADPKTPPAPPCRCSFLSSNTDSEWWPHEPNCPYVLHMEEQREKNKNWWVNASKGAVREKPKT